ncbi:hypothetical protein IscW_ISCW005519 [Ixodes scapularis]|uniref:Uncharacterized protein n=1 Tax=Ixodes scapularis TaxID=6945 RepID=B7PPA6_IXOSC|nr:hypothetical protein IscW_ISCW005519 [Ixodes scapularis]|eukprot:XP_002435598.1 hypothetical protein IscW_ISCW005519 [Ixodes scapularis]
MRRWRIGVWKETSLSGGLICALLLLQTALQQVSASSRSRYGRKGRIQQTADSSDEPYWSPPPRNSHHGNRRYDQHFDQPPDYYYDYKHDYKHDYDIVFPLLLLIMAPLAVSAFLLPITASLMTNTFFLVNGATNAAIQGRRRRSAGGQPSQELLGFLDELEKAIGKYELQHAQRPLKSVPI